MCCITHTQTHLLSSKAECIHTNHNNRIIHIHNRNVAPSTFNVTFLLLHSRPPIVWFRTLFCSLQNSFPHPSRMNMIVPSVGEHPYQKSIILGLAKAITCSVPKDTPRLFQIYTYARGAYPPAVTIELISNRDPWIHFSRPSPLHMVQRAGA